MKEVLISNDFTERKIQFINLKTNKNFIGKPENINYEDIISFLETSLDRDKYIQYEGSLYCIDGTELLKKLNQSDDYALNELSKITKDKLPKDLKLYFVDPDKFDSKPSFFLENKSAELEDIKRIEQWKNFKFTKGLFEDRKLLDIKIEYINTSSDKRFRYPLYSQYYNMSYSPAEISNFVKIFGTEFCFRTNNIENEFFNRYLNKDFEKLMEHKEFKGIDDTTLRFMLIRGIFNQIVDSYFNNDLDSFEQELVHRCASSVKILNIKENYPEIWDKNDSIDRNTIIIPDIKGNDFLSENIYRVYNWKDYVYFELQDLFINTRRCINCGHPLPHFVDNKAYKGKYCPKNAKNYNSCNRERNRKRQKSFYDNLTKT